MGLLDNSDSEYDSSLSSCEDWHPKKHEKRPSSVLEGDVGDRLQAILQLKDELHLEEDPDYARKEAKKKEIQKEAEKEKRSLEEMTPEERLEAQRASVGNMMDMIRQKRQSSIKKNPIPSSSHKRRGVQRTFSSASAASTDSEYSAASSCLSEMELSEFQRLKAKKALRKKKRDSKKVAAKQ